VADGDSLTLDSDGVIHEVRLSGIDAPELKQDQGRAAKAALAAMVQGKWVTFTDSGQDSYHRNLVRLYVDGMDVNLQLVMQGFAWHYHAYSKDPALAAAEQEAKMHRRGLWSQANPVPPWNWRRRR
jgi:endonuclease YncB( thermonuclease family)